MPSRTDASSPLAVSLGVISDEVSQDYGRVVAFAREQKLDGIELRSTGGKAFKDLSAAEIDEIARRTEEAGLRIPSVATPVFKCSVDDPAEIKQHIDLFKRSVDHARRLGAGIVRVFAFLRKDEPTRPDELCRAAENSSRWSRPSRAPASGSAWKTRRPRWSAPAPR